MDHTMAPVSNWLEMQTASAQPVFKAQRYSKKEWEEQRSMIEGQWKDLKIKMVVDLLREERGFFVTEKQLKDRKRAWGLGKNVKTSEMKVIVRKQAQKREEGKYSRIRVRGQAVDQNKIARWQKRMKAVKLGAEKKATTPSPPATPSDISCSTVTPPHSPKLALGDFTPSQYVLDEEKITTHSSTPVLPTQSQEYPLHFASPNAFNTPGFGNLPAEDNQMSEITVEMPVTFTDSPRFNHSAQVIERIYAADTVKAGARLTLEQRRRSQSSSSPSSFSAFESMQISKDPSMHARTLKDPALPCENPLRHGEQSEEEPFKHYQNFEFSSGSNHVTVLEMAEGLAQARLKGDFQFADEPFESPASAVRSAPGTHDPRHLSTAASLALVFRIKGGNWLQEHLSQLTSSDAQAVLPGTDPACWSFEDYYAISLCSLGLVREAEDEFDMMPRISSGRHLDPDDSNNKLLLNAKYVHAVLLMESGEFDAAEKISLEILQALKSATRPDKRFILSLMSLLGELANLRLDPKAESLLGTVYDQHVRILGPEHRDTLHVQSLFATALSRAEKTSQAFALREDLVDKARRTLGAKEIPTLEYKLDLASSLIEMKQFDKAVEIARKVSVASKVLL